jgi:hypothetical protein
VIYLYTATPRMVSTCRPFVLLFMYTALQQP